jgi:hypothetical protein
MAVLQNSTDIVSSNVVFVNNPSVINQTGAAASNSQGAVNIWTCNNSQFFECFNTIATTNTNPILSSTSGRGLNINNVLAAISSGIELTEGITAASKNARIVGTSPPFYVQAAFNVNTVLDVANVFVGFRILGAYQTTLSSYSDYCTLGMVTSGEIETKTQKASGGNITTDTTQSIAGNTTFTFRINVDGNGNVTYLLNGLKPTITSAYQLAANTVVPFLWYQTSAIGNSEVDFIYYSCGLQ